MTKRILILDTDKAFVRQLVAGLSKIDTFIISQATTLQEAGKIVGRDNQDLAFVPVAKDAGMVHALRALQPDLILVLTKPTSQYRVSEAFSGKVQGVLIKPLLEIDLATVLQSALAQPVWVDKSRRQQRVPRRQQEKSTQLDTALVITTLQQADLGRLVQAAVFSEGRQLLAHWGEVDDTEAALQLEHSLLRRVLERYRQS